MAPWGDTKLFFCILFITCCCCTVTFAQIPMDCCLSVNPKVFERRNLVVDYRRQISGQGCSIDAMILVTRAGRKLCVPLDKPWVRRMVKHVEERKRICKKQQYKGKKCTGVKRV